MSLDLRLVCEHCGSVLAESNITHNLNKMADAVGIYEILWRPDEVGITRSGEITDRLESGLSYVKSNMHSLRKFEPENKWGTVESLIRFLEEIIVGCKNFPNAKLVADR